MPVSVRGVVRDLGSDYADGFRQLEIHVPVEHAAGLPHQVGARVPITLSLGGNDYLAGLRATEDSAVVCVCPDLLDHADRRTTLGRVLSRNGLGPNAHVLLNVSGSSIQVQPALANEEL